MRSLVYILLFFIISNIYAEDFENKTDKVVVPVKISKPMEKISYLTIEVPAVVNIDNFCTINSKTEGYIITLIGRGDFVKKGMKIAEVKNEFLKTNIASLNNKINLSEEELNNLNKKLKNYEELYKLGLLSKNDLSDLKNTVIAKNLELENLKNQLKLSKIQEVNSKILSTCEGYIVEIIPNQSYIQLGSQIAKVYNPKKNFLSLYIPIEYLTQMKVNQNIKIKVLQKWYTAKIKEIIPVSDANLIEVKVYPVNDFSLPLNYKFTAEIEINETNGFSIPKEAIIIKDNKPFIFVVVGNKAKIRPVNILKDLGNEVLVSGNLSLNDQIIIHNAYRLEDGTEVIIK